MTIELEELEQRVVAIGVKEGVFAMRPSEAWEKGACMGCGAKIVNTHRATGEPGNIYSWAGRREYQISALCETCFDKFTKEAD